MSVKFGTSGVRGLASDLLGGMAGNYARAFARHLKANGSQTDGIKVLVAADLRASSPALKEQVMAAIAVEGLLPMDCGSIATPVLAAAAMARRLPSVMVTGSHIPADRNGIKFYLASGEITKSDEAAIAALAQTPFAAEASPVTSPRLDGLEDAFIDRYLRCLPGKVLSGLHIGVYEHSTVARDLLVDLLTKLGADVTRIGHSQTFVAVDTETVDAETQEKLKAWSAAHRLDAIVSADGDGDRPLATDEHGNLIRGDLLGILAARLLEADCVVTPITSNSGIERSLPCLVIRTRVGSPYVIAGMEEAKAAGHRAIVGFEANGGVLLGSDITMVRNVLPALPTRDAVLPIISLLLTRARTGRPLSATVRDMALPVSVAGRIENVPEAVSQALLDALHANPQAVAALARPHGDVASVNYSDGLHIALNNRKTLRLRASGNEPVLRCYVEATSETVAAQGLAALMNDLAPFIKAHLH